MSYFPNLSKKAAYAIIFILLVLACAAAAFGITKSAEAKRKKIDLENIYNKSYVEFTADIGNMRDTTVKLMATETGDIQQQLLLNTLIRDSGNALLLLNQLPYFNENISGINYFLNQIGDFASYVNGKILRNTSLSEEDRSSIKRISEALTEFSDYLIGVDGKDGYGYVRFGEGDYSIKDFRGLESTEGAKQDFPILIYDGPFSESAQKKEPLGTTGKDIGYKAAQSKLEAALTMKPDKLGKYSDSSGVIPAYHFAGTQQDGKRFNALIAHKGGALVWMMKDYLPKYEIGSTLDDDARKSCIKAASDYLDSIGYEKMSQNYWQYYQGIAVVNFAYEDKNITYYPDLIKVWVDVETKEIIGLDARNYLLSHRDREVATPAISIDDARNNLNNNLEFVSGKQALIPKKDGTEVLCYEMQCSMDNYDFLVYINAYTGESEDLFRIVHAPDGKLVK